MSVELHNGLFKHDASKEIGDLKVGAIFVEKESEYVSQEVCNELTKAEIILIDRQGHVWAERVNKNDGGFVVGGQRFCTAKTRPRPCGKVEDYLETHIVYKEN